MDDKNKRVDSIISIYQQKIHQLENDNTVDALIDLGSIKQSLERLHEKVPLNAYQKRQVEILVEKVGKIEHSKKKAIRNRRYSLLIISIFMLIIFVLLILYPIQENAKFNYIASLSSILGFVLAILMAIITIWGEVC